MLVATGFMSTTLDQQIALEYSLGEGQQPSTVLGIQMDERNRGALISFLSCARLHLTIYNVSPERHVTCGVFV